MNNRHRSLLALATLASIAVVVSGTSDAHGADDKAACVASYDRSQVLRHDHRLQLARDELRSCSRAACPALVRNDCITWLDQVQQEVPSLAIRATKDGADLANVTVFVDDQVVTTKLDGTSLEVDPGEHTLRFETDGAPPVTMKLVAHEREHDRVVPVTFTTNAASPAGPTPAASGTTTTTRPVPAGAIVLGGIGAAGLITFGALGIVGKTQQASLRDTCSPNCSQHDIGKIRTEYVAADVAAGVGAAALVSAALWFVLRPSHTEAAANAPPVTVAIAPTREGATVDLAGRF